MRFAKRHFLARGKAVLAALLVALILLLDAMAACPALHELIHHDADKPGHECAVTFFAHGQVDSASVELPEVAVVVSVVAAPPFEFSVFRPAIGNLPAGRAPPVLQSVS